MRVTKNLNLRIFMLKVGVVKVSVVTNKQNICSQRASTIINLWNAFVQESHLECLGAQFSVDLTPETGSI